MLSLNIASQVRGSQAGVQVFIPDGSTGCFQTLESTSDRSTFNLQTEGSEC